MLRRGDDGIAQDEIHPVRAGGAGIAQPGALCRRRPPGKGCDAGAMGVAAQINRDIHFQFAHFFRHALVRHPAYVMELVAGRNNAGARDAVIILAG